MNSADSANLANTISTLAAMRVAVFTLTSLAETRASSNGKRFVRLQSYVTALARALKRRRKFELTLTEAFSAIYFERYPCMTSAKSAFQIGFCSSRIV